MSHRCIGMYMTYLAATVIATASTHRRTIPAKLGAPPDSSSADPYAGFLGGLDASLSAKRPPHLSQARVDLLNQSANFVIGKGERSVRVQLESSACLDRRGLVGVTGFPGVRGRAAASVV